MGTPNCYSKDIARKHGFRSGFEMEFAKELDDLGVDYEYETPACTFKYFRNITNGGIVDKSGCPMEYDKDWRIVQWCDYTCDFMLIKADGRPLYIETKGRFLPKDRTKHRLLKKQYPDVDIRLLFSENGKVSSKSRYLDWAAKYDIPAGLIVKPTKRREGKYIPREWLTECGIPYQS
jgi:hypothetical protein